MSIEPSYAAGGPRWLPRAERFVRHALLAEPAFLDLYRVAFFYPSLGNSEEMANSTFRYSIGTFFTQTHSNALVGNLALARSTIMRNTGYGTRNRFLNVRDALELKSERALA